MSIRKLRENKICENCQKTFTKKWPFELKKARFCSQLCANQMKWKETPFTEEHKKKLTEGRKKFVYSEELRNKMSEIKKGCIPWNKGLEMWTGEKRKNLVTPEIKFGAEHPNWKGGLSVIFVRKQRLSQNGGSHTKSEWETLKAQYNWTCPCCKIKEPEIKLSLDHIIPVAKGGSDNIENIQPLCRSCNAKKHTTEIKYDLVPVGDYPNFDY